MKTPIVILCALALTGCASVGRTLRRHPVMTAVGVALVAGGIYAATEGHAARHPPCRYYTTFGGVWRCAVQ